jgi:hypothetical protein
MKFRILAMAPLALLSVSAVFACGDREYEQCWRVDLGPLGEAKDCKCLPKVDVPKPVEDIKAEADRLLENVRREVENTPQAIQECLGDPNKCVMEIISAPLAAPVQAYIDGLYRQSEGRTYPFSKEFVALAQPYFSVDLGKLTWANDIDTGSGMSVSYCDRIFFANHNSLWNSQSELHHVLHEIEHTVQCQARGKRTYLAEYVLKVGMDVLKTGRFDVHDMHDYERAANAKADQATAPIWAQIENGAPQPPPIYVQGPAPIPGPIQVSGPGPIPQPMTAPMNPVRFCQTQMLTCQIPPAMAPMGTPCFCVLPNGQQIWGNAY